MPDFASEISTLVSTAPADLVLFYREAVRPNYPKSRIRCLPFHEAKDYTEKMRGIPVVDRLGLWTLDDANDSNPFCYITQGPCAGMIIHFSHDPEPEIAFPSLPRLVAAMNSTGAQGLDIDEMAKETISISLDSEIRNLAKEDSEEAVFLLTTYLPICLPLEIETKSVLVAHDDFFVREALATYIARTAFDQDLPVADRLAADQHPQVARRAKIAVDAIKAKRGRG